MRRFEYTGGELPMFNGARHPFPETAYYDDGARVCRA